MRRRRYRQMFLVLAVLILPGVLIAVQGLRIAAQEKELAKARLEDIRKRTAAEIGQELFTRLERIKTQEMANMPGATVPQRRYSDPAVVAAGWADGERLVWLWDIGIAPGERLAENPEFALALREARIAQFREKNPSRAAEVYRQAMNLATGARERAAAGLGLAGSLARSGQDAAAAAACRDLIELPSELTAADGFSQWSSAATFCAELGVGSQILMRVAQDLESPTAWPPPQMYRFKTILEGLRDSGGPEVKAGAASAIEGLTARLQDLEEALELQKDFAKLRVTAAEWQTYQPHSGAELWLVGRAPNAEGGAARPLVLAVRLQTLVRAIESDRSNGPRFVISSAIASPDASANAGDPLSEYLPGLRIAFPEGVKDPAGPNSQLSLWGLSFALVAALTLLGGYLLWRDVRREGQIAELRTQFVSNVSHELKTPLTSIRMFAELLQMRESVDPEQGVFLSTIVSESERLTRLLNNVLDFSRIERGEKIYRLEPAPLADVVQAAVRAIQYPLSQQGFRLDLNVSDEVPPVALDRDAVQQAILNLLTNAMKYSGEQREIGLRLAAENGDALIQVSDRGICIPETEQARIFEKFYRVSVPENRDIAGTGLGLALVAHIAHAHGGSVEVKSKPGEGSTFSIRLPLNAEVAA